MSDGKNENEQSWFDSWVHPSRPSRPNQVDNWPAVLASRATRNDNGYINRQEIAREHPELSWEEIEQQYYDDWYNRIVNPYSTNSTQGTDLLHDGSGVGYIESTEQTPWAFDTEYYTSPWPARDTASPGGTYMLNSKGWRLDENGNPVADQDYVNSEAYVAGSQARQNTNNMYNALMSTLPEGVLRNVLSGIGDLKEKASSNYYDPGTTPGFA